MKKQDGVAYFHLPGLFEFYELYKVFLPLFHEHREYFYDWCDIGSIYGAPADCIWGGGRVGDGDGNAREVLSLVNKYGISARLTFSNSLLREEHLADRRCNELCRMFCREQDRDKEIYNTGDLNRRGNYGCGYGRVRNGVIIHSELLLDYLKASYPELYLVSSTTKVLTDFDDLVKELGRLDAPGRPLLFGTTEEFLRHFGLQSLEDLPIINPVQLEDFKAEAEEEVQQKLDVEV